jgi:HlyD family secretion protein
MLIKPGGVFDVFTKAPGQITEISVAEGDAIAAGQIIARIDQPDLLRQIANTRQQIAELTAQHKELTAFTSRDLTLRSDSHVLREAQLKETITFAESRIAALKDQLASEEALLEKGLLTRQTLLQTRQALFSAQDLVERSRSELQQLPLERLTNTSTKEQQIVQSQLRINEAQRQLGVLERQHDEASTVISPYTGRIVEMKLDRGEIAGPGSALLSLEITDDQPDHLQAIVYVPPTTGKNVLAGMEAQISPSTVPRQEFGFLIGTVTYVSEFPATTEGMLRVLGNPGLVQTLTAEGPPYAVYADLQRKDDGGFLWSSAKGETQPVNSGTLCSVTITVRERRPIEMVIPTVRQFLGL